MAERSMHLPDAVTGAIVLASGLFVAIEAWNMPRFEERDINPWTIPGIMPGFVGVTLSVLGFLLLARAIVGLLLSTRERPADLSTPGEEEAETAPVLIGTPALAFCVVSGLAFVTLIGHVPFIPLAFVFLLTFMAVFEARSLARSGRKFARSLWIVFYAGAAAVLISLLFRDVFLVQLP